MTSGWLGTFVDAVIFDHDGTLVDSETITLTLIATMAVELGAEVYPDDAERFVGADIHLALDEIEKRIGQPLNKDAFLEEFRSRQELEIRSSLSEISGATELLEALTHQEIPFAVASNAPVAKMEVCLEATDLLRLVPHDRLISAYEVDAWKPDPAVFLRAAEVLGESPDRCAVVEDSLPGIEGALAAGMRVIALDPKGKFAERIDVTSVPSLGAAQTLLQQDHDDRFFFTGAKRNHASHS